MSGVEVISQESEEWPTTGGTAYPSPMDQEPLRAGHILTQLDNDDIGNVRATDKAAQCLADKHDHDHGLATCSYGLQLHVFTQQSSVRPYQTH